MPVIAQQGKLWYVTTKVGNKRWYWNHLTGWSTSKEGTGYHTLVAAINNTPITRPS